MARSKKTQAAIDGALSLNVAEGQVGLGVDMVEIARMRKILARTPSFEDKYFTEGERAYCRSKADPVIHFAARFAAKEAVVKALGCGFVRGIAPRDIEVVSSKSGKPEIALSGVAQEVAQESGVKDIPISISHTKNDAIACAIAITESSQVAAEKRKDPMEELAKQFKDARSMLDGI